MCASAARPPLSGALLLREWVVRRYLRWVDVLWLFSRSYSIAELLLFRWLVPRTSPLRLPVNGCVSVSERARSSTAHCTYIIRALLHGRRIIQSHFLRSGLRFGPTVRASSTPALNLLSARLICVQLYAPVCFASGRSHCETATMGHTVLELAHSTRSSSCSYRASLSCVDWTGPTRTCLLFTCFLK